MTDNGAPSGSPTRPDPRAGLESMKMPELKTLASGLGVKSAGSLRKGPLVEAILATQGLGSGASKAPSAAESAPSAEAPKTDKASSAPPGSSGQPSGPEKSSRAPKTEKTEKVDRTASDDRGDQGDRSKQGDQPKQGDQSKQSGDQPKRGSQSGQKSKDEQPKQSGQGSQNNQGGQNNQKSKDDRPKQSGNSNQNNQNNQGSAKNNQNNQNNQGNQNLQDNDAADDDDEAGSRRNRRRRGRDRNERQRGRGEPDLAVYEDDVLVPAAGILDVLDNYAFVRTTGYLAGVDDVYVSLSMVRKFGLRRGDAVVGQVRQPREGERKEKFNPLVKIESVNGSEPDSSGKRVAYEDLTPVFADERIRLETGPEEMTGRLLDVVAPLGKGQRVLVLSPSSGGRSTLLRHVAAAVATNDPEAHLMVVLVDERPEEVTELQRSVRGEVIASTCDRPATDHTTLAELAVERAKRLVELGHDVVVLFDGLSRLARAYNLAAPPGGRVLPGGLDTTALLPVKQLFGSARNVEDGGSLTMLATAAVDNDSEADQLVLEEVRGAATAQLRLRRDLVEAGVVPAVDLAQCWSLREDLLAEPEELEGIRALRQEALAGQADATAATSTLLARLGSRRTNAEVLRALVRG